MPFSSLPVCRFLPVLTEHSILYPEGQKYNFHIVCNLHYDSGSRSGALRTGGSKRNLAGRERGRGAKRSEEPRKPPRWFDEGVVGAANVRVEEDYGVVSNERATDIWQSRRGRRRGQW